MLASIAVTQTTTAQVGVWDIGPRTLPPSKGVSDVFHDYLSKSPTPDIEAAKAIRFENSEQLKAWARERDAKAATVARKLAKALSVTIQHDTIDGVNVYHVMPSEVASEHRDHLFVHIHGGAYVLNGGEAATIEAILIASNLKMPVISIDYRMPPSDPAPAAMEDVVAVWKHLLKDRSAASMAMGGTSAGGGLTMSSVHRFKELGLDLPQALFVGTPASEIGKIGDSRYINEGIDQGLIIWDGAIFEMLKMYAGKYDIKHPHVSPIYGDFAGFPPTYLISGTRDLMLSDTVRVHRKMRRAGVEAELHIYEGQSHGEYLKVMNAPESHEHFIELNKFLFKHLSIMIIPTSQEQTETTKSIKIPESATY
jgi:acetyl esterase/lipase